MRTAFSCAILIFAAPMLIFLHSAAVYKTLFVKTPRAIRKLRRGLPIIGGSRTFRRQPREQAQRASQAELAALARSEGLLLPTHESSSPPRTLRKPYLR